MFRGSSTSNTHVVLLLDSCVATPELPQKATCRMRNRLPILLYMCDYAMQVYFNSLVTSLGSEPRRLALIDFGDAEDRSKRLRFYLNRLSCTTPNPSGLQSLVVYHLLSPDTDADLAETLLHHSSSLSHIILRIHATLSPCRGSSFPNMYTVLPQLSKLTSLTLSNTAGHTVNGSDSPGFGRALATALSAMPTLASFELRMVHQPNPTSPPQSTSASLPQSDASPAAADVNSPCPVAALCGKGDVPTQSTS